MIAVIIQPSLQLHDFLSENIHISCSHGLSYSFPSPFILAPCLSLGALLGLAVAELVRGPWGLAGPTCILIE